MNPSLLEMRIQQASSAVSWWVPQFDVLGSGCRGSREFAVLCLRLLISDSDPVTISSSRRFAKGEYMHQPGTCCFSQPYYRVNRR